jgi:hypothetical protein
MIWRAYFVLCWYFRSQTSEPRMLATGPDACHNASFWQIPPPPRFPHFPI